MARLLRVLIVDDDALLRRTVQLMLEGESYEMLAVASGNEALELLQETSCDVVVTDIVMPDSDGIETCSRIMQHHPQTKVVAMSGAPAREIYLAIVERMGVSIATLSKPFTKDQLLSVLDRVLKADPS